MTCGNILKLAGFGIAAQVENFDEGYNEEDSETILYMPQELYGEEPKFSAKTEIFSLGIVIYYLCYL